MSCRLKFDFNDDLGMEPVTARSTRQIDYSNTSELCNLCGFTSPSQIFAEGWSIGLCHRRRLSESALLSVHNPEFFNTIGTKWTPRSAIIRSAKLLHVSA
jgi:hypothetical protein